jgi:alpha-L-fucosidase
MGWLAESDPHRIFAHYYTVCADGLVNDRWTQLKLPANGLARSVYLRFITVVLKLMARTGRRLPAPVPNFHFDIETHEYDAPSAAIVRPWELTRGLGKSFGYNAQERAADMMTGAQLIHLLSDVVSKGGNLLINVGPDGYGRIPDIQQEPLRELGTWLGANGAAIFGTRPWSCTRTTTADGDEVRFTEKEGIVYLIVLGDRLPDTLIVRNLTASAGSTLRLLGDTRELHWSEIDGDLRISVPPRPVAACPRACIGRDIKLTPPSRFCFGPWSESSSESSLSLPAVAGGSA